MRQAAQRVVGSSGRRLCTVAVLAACCGAAQAHHSIAGIYDGRRQATLTAVVREFRFVNPHPLIVVDVVDESEDETGGSAGKPWTLEMDNRWELAALGFRNDTLEPGDRIVVTGSLARHQTRALYVRRLAHAAEAFEYEHHR